MILKHDIPWQVTNVATSLLIYETEEGMKIGAIAKLTAGGRSQSWNRHDKLIGGVFAEVDIALPSDLEHPAENNSFKVRWRSQVKEATKPCSVTDFHESIQQKKVEPLDKLSER